jgi:hypothetical protein
MGNNITCTINCNCRTAATLYTLETVCFRYIIVNTVHRGGGDDNSRLQQTLKEYIDGENKTALVTDTAVFLDL